MLQSFSVARLHSLQPSKAVVPNKSTRSCVLLLTSWSCKQITSIIQSPTSAQIMQLGPQKIISQANTQNEIAEAPNHKAEEILHCRLSCTLIYLTRVRQRPTIWSFCQIFIIYPLQLVFFLLNVPSGLTVLITCVFSSGV